MGDINDGRVLPFLDVGLPEIGAFTARGNGVSPGALAGAAEVVEEEEFEDGRDLCAYEKDGRVWRRGGDALGDVTGWVYISRCGRTGDYAEGQLVSQECVVGETTYPRRPEHDGDHQRSPWLIARREAYRAKKI